MIGLARNVHFITHAAPEEYVEGGVLSPRNVHEARALLLLCGVLLGVGYSNPTLHPNPSPTLTLTLTW